MKSFKLQLKFNNFYRQQLSIGLLLLLAIQGLSLLNANEDRPNILWLTSEDNGPHLGCYGDTYADTPPH